MQIGKLRHRIVIQTPTETKSASGETTTAWGTFASVRACLEPTGGTEQWQSDQVLPTVTQRITIRWIPGITPKMRIKYDDVRQGDTRYFGIESARDLEERGHWIELMCIEVVST